MCLIRHYGGTREGTMANDRTLRRWAPVFGIVRRKSSSQLVRQELSQSVEHLKQAANHAARGTGATVGPKFYAARDRMQPTAGRVKDAASTRWGSAVATLAPLATAATDTVRKADKDTRKAANKNQKKLQKKTAKAMSKKSAKGKKSKLTSLLVAGAAVGAAGAYALRRRNSQKWDEYDPGRPVGSSQTTTTSDDIVFEPGEPTGTTAFTGGQSTPSTGIGVQPEATIPPLGTDLEDQTSSTMHTPNVARLAGGTTQS